MLDKVKKKLKSLSEEGWFFWFSLFFYVLLYFNLNNKTVYLAFLLLVVLYYRRIRKWGSAFYLTAVASVPILIGKLFDFILIPEKYLAIDVNSVYSYFAITPLMVLTGVLLLWFLDCWVIRKDFEFKSLNKWDGFLNGFLWLGLISVYFSLRQEVAFLGWLVYFQAVLFYFISRFFLQKNRKNISRVVGVLQAGVVWESGWAILQGLRGGLLGSSIGLARTLDQSFLVPIEDPLKFRPSGTFSHPNELAWFLGVILPVVFALNYKKSSWRRALVLLVGLVGISLTLGRSGWGSAGAGMLLVYVLMRFWGKRSLSFPEGFKFMVFPVIFILGWFFLLRLLNLPQAFEKDGSFRGRLEIFSEYFELFKNYPYFGVGPELSIPRAFYRNPTGRLHSWPANVHNIYMHLLVEVGVFSSLSFLIGVYGKISSTLKSFVDKLRQKRESVVRVGVLGGLLSIFLNGFFQPLFSFSLVYGLLLLSMFEYEE